MGRIQKIVPFLWFDNQAEAAAKFYTSVFQDSEILKTRYYSDGAPAPKGSVMGVDFTIEGQKFYSFNGGPMYQFSPATSLFVHCDSQKEIDHLWDKLSKGGAEQGCGWVTDKFGITWQIIPNLLSDLLQSPDANKAQKATAAMMKMKKINIAELESAIK